MFGHTKVKNERESFNLLLFVWYLTFFLLFKNDYYHYLSTLKGMFDTTKKKKERILSSVLTLSIVVEFADGLDQLSKIV